MALRSALRARDEDGYTVAELAVVLLLFGVIGVTIATTLASMTTATTSAGSRSQALADNRGAIEVIARDLRAANPLDRLATVDEYRTKVQFSVYCSTPSAATGCGTDHLRPITYEVVDNELRRTVAGSTTVLLGPSGPATLPPARQLGAIVNPAATPPFTFFDRNGQQLAFAGAPETFRNCTKSVRIRLVVVSDAGRVDAGVDIDTEVNLRNYNKVTNCT